MGGVNMGVVVCGREKKKKQKKTEKLVSFKMSFLNTFVIHLWRMNQGNIYTLKGNTTNIVY